MKVRILLGAAVIAFGAGLAGLAGPVVAASADPVSAPLCPAAGLALAGTHHNLTVRGNAYVADGATLTVTGNLRLAPGSCLDAFSLGTVHVGHNVLVSHGATLALGCAPGANGPPPIAPCYFQTTNDTVGGSIIAYGPQTMYLTAVTVGHNVISIGGGPGTAAVGVSFPVKNMNIHGNLVLAGWHGGWIGALRNHVDGDMVIAGNAGSRIGESGVPDSTEIVTNTIAGKLACYANVPAAQFGDSGGSPNIVGGFAVGQCGFGVLKPNPTPNGPLEHISLHA